LGREGTKVSPVKFEGTDAAKITKGKDTAYVVLRGTKNYPHELSRFVLARQNPAPEFLDAIIKAMQVPPKWRVINLPEGLTATAKADTEFEVRRTTADFGPNNVLNPKRLGATGETNNLPTFFAVLSTQPQPGKKPANLKAKPLDPDQGFALHFPLVETSHPLHGRIIVSQEATRRFVHRALAAIEKHLQKT